MRLLWKLFLFVTLSLATLAQVPSVHISTIESTEQNFEQFGPRVDNVLIKMYDGNDFRLQQDLETGEVDIIDLDLSQQTIDKWSQAPYNETIAMEKSVQTRMYLLDINNNETIPSYRDWRSPTSYAEFRHAIAHLVNKTRIVNEILKGYGMEMTTPVTPCLSEWFNPTADAHPYNPEEAAAILNAAGFTQGSTPNPNHDPSRPGSAQFMRMYPPGHEKSGQDIDPLIFYVRHDDANRYATAYMIHDELLSVGIPVTIPGPIKIQLIENKIMDEHDYHLYTGGWFLRILPDYLYSIYHSSFYWYPGPCSNYNHVSDEELDYWLEKLYDAVDCDTAKTACFNAQARLAEIVGVVPLWCPTSVGAYRKDSQRAPLGWTGVVNQNCEGIDSLWTFLNMHQNGFEEGGVINYGLYSPTGGGLNPIDADWAGEAAVLSKIYETLLTYEPNGLSLMPWLAEDFEVGSWFNGDVGTNCTKLLFHFPDNILWHDGTPFTSADVEFTINYLLQYESWFWPPEPVPRAYYVVQDVHHVEAPDPNTVIIYMKSYHRMLWSLYYIGCDLYVIPKHIWQNISKEDGLGTMPDPSLIGTGPFKLVDYVLEDYCLLEANQDYRGYCPIQISVAFTSRHVEPGESICYNVTIINCFADKSVTLNISIFFDNVLIENKTVSLGANASILLGPYSSGDLCPGLHELEIDHSPDPYTNRTCTYHSFLWTSYGNGAVGGRCRPPLLQ